MSLAAVGIGLTAYGMLRKGMASEAAHEYNAAVLEEEARQEQIRLHFIKERIRRQKAQMMGAQRAGYAKAGVKLEGTPLQVMADTAAQYEKDIIIEDYNTRVTIARKRAGASAERIAGEEAVVSAVTMAGGTVLSGISPGGGSGGGGGTL